MELPFFFHSAFDGKAHFGKKLADAVAVLPLNFDSVVFIFVRTARAQLAFQFFSEIFEIIGISGKIKNNCDGFASTPGFFQPKFGDHPLRGYDLLCPDTRAARSKFPAAWALHLLGVGGVNKTAIVIGGHG